MVVDSTLDKMYALVHYDSRILFFKLDTNTGAALSSTFSTLTALTCTKTMSLVRNSSKLYGAFQ